MKDSFYSALVSTKGNVSSTRWVFLWSNRVSWCLAFLSVSGSVAFGFYSIFKQNPLQETASLVSAILLGTAGIIAAVSGSSGITKAIQSHAEKNEVESKNSGGV